MPNLIDFRREGFANGTIRMRHTSKAEQPATGELHPTILTVQVRIKKHAQTPQKQTLVE